MVLLSGNIGSVGTYSLNLAGLKLTMEFKLPSLGLDAPIVEDASGLISVLEGYLDAKFPAAKAFIDGGLGILQSSLAAIV